MSHTPSTRRDFLLTSGRAAGAAWLAANASLLRATAARAAESRRAGVFAVLTEAEAREIEAMAARIIPSGDTPGAREAGVVHFIDGALETFMSSSTPVVRGAAEALNAAAAERGAERFSDLGPEVQDEIVGLLEAGEGEEGGPPFFSVVRFLTVAGMFSSPEHGGNRDGAGWEVLDFQDAPVWRPPFGWYDRDAHGAGAGGGS